jgi:hypothetical protein
MHTLEGVGENETYLERKCFPDLTENLTPARCRNIPEVDIRFAGLFERRAQFFGRSLQAGMRWTLHQIKGRTHTVFTRAKTSPVAGHRLSSTSPEPVQAPSYTPGSSVASPVGSSSADRTADARDERERFRAERRGTRRNVCASIVVVASVQAQTGAREDAGPGTAGSWQLNSDQPPGATNAGNSHVHSGLAFSFSFQHASCCQQDCDRKTRRHDVHL